MNTRDLDASRPAETWLATRGEIARELAAAGIVTAEAEARFLVEEVSGYAAADWSGVADAAPSARARTRLRSLVDRRIAGEPLQYVLGSWSFRGIDLMVDPRVLIPRPETEQVVEVALEEAERRGLRRARRRHLSLVDAEPTAAVADLGTGSGAIAIALDAELPDVAVWATDASPDALDVARANLAGCAATRVRLVEGSWFDALPATLRGTLELIVSNPPYVAEREVASLPEEVSGFEPRRALVPGPTGDEALVHLLSHTRATGSCRAACSCASSRRARPTRWSSARSPSGTPTPSCARIWPVGRVCSSPGLGRFEPMPEDQLDVDAMLERFRERAAAVERRNMPPVAGDERARFIEQAQLDFQDYAIVGDASWTFVDGVLTLTVDLRPS